jgi:hypothetical protein
MIDPQIVASPNLTYKSPGAGRGDSISAAMMFSLQ